MSAISIVIISWNARAYLRECLESLRATHSPVVREIIIVDNASSDGSPDMVQSSFPEVALIRSSENLGFARANNLGIERASGEFVALVNSDVVVHKDCFERLAAFLREHQDVGLVGPKIIGADGQLQCSCRRLPGIWNTFCRIFALDITFSRWSWFSGRQMTNLRSQMRRLK